MVTEYISRILTNGDLHIYDALGDEYCDCNCHKYTCTPNPDTYDCKHCYPDRYFDTSPADASPLRVPDAGPAADAPGGEHKLADR